MIPLLFSVALDLDLACPAPIVDATAGAKVERLQRELRETQLAVIAERVNKQVEAARKRKEKH